MSEKESAYEVHPKHTGIKERDGRSERKEFGPWIKLSTGFRDRFLAELKGSPLAVFLCLALHLDQDYRAWPSVEIIAKETGYDRRTVSRALEKLVDKELIIINRRRSESQMFANNRYKVQAFAGYGRSRPGDKMSHGSDPGDITTEPTGHLTTVAQCPSKKNQQEKNQHRHETDPQIGSVESKPSRDVLVSALLSFGLSEKLASEEIDTYPGQMIFDTCKVGSELRSNGQLRNPAGWIRSVLKNGGAKLPNREPVRTAKEFSQVWAGPNEE